MLFLTTTPSPMRPRLQTTAQVPNISFWSRAELGRLVVFANPSLSPRPSLSGLDQELEAGRREVAELEAMAREVEEQVRRRKELQMAQLEERKEEARRRLASAQRELEEGGQRGGTRFAKGVFQYSRPPLHQGAQRLHNRELTSPTGPDWGNLHFDWDDIEKRKKVKMVKEVVVDASLDDSAGDIHLADKFQEEAAFGFVIDEFFLNLDQDRNNNTPVINKLLEVLDEVASEDDPNEVIDTQDVISIGPTKHEEVNLTCYIKMTQLNMNIFSINTPHIIEEISCSKCDKVFVNRNSRHLRIKAYRRHLLSHYVTAFSKVLPNVKPFSCPAQSCPLQHWRKRMDLVRHYAYKHGAIFQLTDVTPRQLAVHKAQELRLNGHRCNICEKFFFSDNSLYVHKSRYHRGS